jgi:HAD superfamily hydrolase (TIGR01459 family)
MQIEKSCLNLIKNYDAFLVDVWGVIHSGGVLYSNTQNAMVGMMKQGFVLLLSNAPRKASKVASFLAGIGIEKGVHYNEILTSGQAFLLHAQKSKYKTVFYIGPDRDLDIFTAEKISDLSEDFTQDIPQSITITQSIEDDFDDAIVTGLTNQMDISVDFPKLEALIQKGVTLSCINPDIVVNNVKGEQELCAGAVAMEYKKIGGNVRYFGKPYGEIYQIALEMLPKGAKILAIGDGIETDILGANKAGIDCVLCKTGIHNKEISWRGIDEFLSEYPQRPNFAIEQL